MPLTQTQRDALNVLRRLKRFYAKDGVAPGVQALSYTVSRGGSTTDCYCIMGAMEKLGLAERESHITARPITMGAREAAVALAKVYHDSPYTAAVEVMEANDQKLKGRSLARREAIMAEWIDEAIARVKAS